MHLFASDDRLQMMPKWGAESAPPFAANGFKRGNDYSIGNINSHSQNVSSNKGHSGNGHHRYSKTANDNVNDGFQRTSCWRFQLAVPRGFAGARVVLKDQVQNVSKACKLSFTRLMAHLGTVLAEKDWLRVAGFAPKQTARPGLVALGKCAVRLETSVNRPPVRSWICFDDAKFVDGA